MKRLIKHSVSLALILFTELLSVNAQNDPADSLRAAGYEINVPSLVRGIQDSSSPIRAEAASVLGEKKYTDALPALEKAISLEKNQNVLFTMLTSAQSLGSSDAAKQLHSFCDPGKDETLQIMAANYLQSIGDNECIKNMIGFTGSLYAGVREGALLYLTHITKLSDPIPDSLGPALIKVIRADSDTYNVQLAAKVIEQIGDAHTKSEYEKYRRP